MDTKLVVFCTLVCTIAGSDVSIGRSTGRKIFDEIRQASPAIWRQIENVTIIAPSDEVISGVVVTDMRPEKDGDAQIVDGGEGKDRVTIELKSPTVLRGYEFHLEVYTESNTKYTDAEENKGLPEMNESTPVSEGSGSGDVSVTMPEENVSTEFPQNSDKDAPTLVGKDTDGNVRPARETNNENNPQTSEPAVADNLPVSTTDMPIENLTTELSENTDKDAPALVGQDFNESVRPARGTNEESTPATSDFENTGSVTEMSETTTELIENSEKDAPISIGKNENIRPARRTDDEDIYQTSDSADPAYVPSIVASEASTTEDPKIDHDQTTTEVNENTTTDEENPAPLMFDNAKNIPDYPSLYILGLIKEKEGSRRIRHTEENDVTTESKNIEQSTTESNENSESYDVSSNPREKTNDDDIVDLMPPEIGTSYNTEFSDASSNTRSDSGDDCTTTQASEVNDEEEKKTEFSASEALLTEQPRNIRNAGVENTDVDSNNVDIPKETQEQPSFGYGLGKSNVIVLNRELLSSDSSHTRYEIPIVLILANGANLPTIKIIFEDSNMEQENPDVNIQPEGQTDVNLENNQEIPKNVPTEFMPSNDEYVPIPAMNVEK